MGKHSIVCGMFKNCASLKTVDASQAVSAEKEAFVGCSALSTIYCMSEKPWAVEGRVFSATLKDQATLYVLNTENVVETYQMTPGWNDFKKIVPLDFSSGILSPLGTTDCPAEKYSLQGIRVTQPQPGSIYIQGGKIFIAR